MFKLLNLKPEIFAVDINDLSLKIVKIKKKRGSFRLVSFGEIKINPGVVEEGLIKNEDQLARTIISALKTIKGEKIGTKYVVVTLPEEKSFSKVIQMPKITEDEIRSALPFEAENYIPLPIEKVYLDFQTINYHKENSNHLDLLISAVPKLIVDSYVSSFKKAGLSPCIMEVESQSLARALIKNGAKSNPAIFVDFGETKTGLMIHDGESIHFTTTVPISSSKITEVLSDELEVNFDDAEKLKVQYGLEKDVGKESINFISIISPIIKELSSQIKKYIDFYHSHFLHDYLSPERKVKKVILSGGGANLKNLPELLSKDLKMPVELANPAINVIKEKSSLIPNKKLLSFSTAIGAALRGAGDTYLNSWSDND